MLLPDHLYRRVPQFWMIMGVLFWFFALMAGPDFRFFTAYLVLGLVSVGRSIWVQRVRQRVIRKSEVTVLTETQKMERKFF